MLCKVISTKNVFGTKADIQKLVLEDQKEPQFLYRLVGELTGYVTGDSKFQRTDPETGEVTTQQWTKFAGDFIAINRNNQKFESVICFLPDYIGGPIREAIRAEPGNSVQVGFDIFALFSEKSATSYEFIAQPLRDASHETKAQALLSAAPPLPNANLLTHNKAKK